MSTRSLGFSELQLPRPENPSEDSLISGEVCLSVATTWSFFVIFS
jgi:hypothetical protein